MKVLSPLLILFFIAVPTAPGSAMVRGLEKVSSGEIRYLGFIKVYTAALFTEAATNRSAILDKETPRCLKIDYSMSFSATDLIAGAEAVLKRQLSSERLDAIEQHIATLHESYADVEEGDSYTLCYDPATVKTTLLRNEEEVVSIASAPFAQAYFGIWLGPEKAIDERLQKQLLENLPRDKR